MTLIQTPDGPRYLGIYRGVVLKDDRDEPRNTHCGRLKVRVPLIHGNNATADQLPWAFPMFPSSGSNCGFVDIPPVQSLVMVVFEGGDPAAPCWLGGWFSHSEFPGKAKYANTYRYPDIKMWRTRGGQMVRLVSDESVEIYAGRDDTVERDPDTGEETRTPGKHGEYDTYIKMDLKRHKMTVKSKYPFTVQSDDKIKVKGVYVDVIANVECDNSGNPIAGLDGNDKDGQPVLSNFRGSKLTLRCIDSTGQTAGQLGLGPSKTGIQESPQPDGSNMYSPISVSSSIVMSPSEIKANARHVKGFKDR